jgi:hypothetical protein
MQPILLSVQDLRGFSPFLGCTKGQYGIAPRGYFQTLALSAILPPLFRQGNDANNYWMLFHAQQKRRPEHERIRSTPENLLGLFT